MSDETISKQAAVEEVRKACFHFSDLYFHFASVLVQELGEEKAKDLAAKAVRSRALERGKKLRASALAKGLEPKNENFRRVTDIPFLGWDASLGRLHCPYGAAWLERYAEAPWFKDFALLYCDVNDTVVTETFTETTSQRITKNVLAGHETCDRIYFPIGKDPGDAE